MYSVRLLYIGALITFGVAFVALIVIPFMQLRPIPPESNLKPYTEQELRGRAEYISQGCVYCHTQQVRDPSIGADAAWGWGRPSVPGDYAYDYPHLLGTMRTGPDLSTIGVRQPNEQWHLLHLYNPRSVVSWSIMPSYPFLFEEKKEAEPGDTILHLPKEFAPEGNIVVAKPSALDLVAYLLSLKRNFPVDDMKQTKASVEEQP